MSDELEALALRNRNMTGTLDSIRAIIAHANDPLNPGGQVQAGIQLARYEVPWLVATVEKLILTNRELELRTADPDLADFANPPELHPLRVGKITGLLGNSG